VRWVVKAPKAEQEPTVPRRGFWDMTEPPRYVIHHGEKHGRQISKVPEHLTMSEFQSNPDLYQFAVGDVQVRERRVYVVTLGGAGCCVELRGSVFACETLREVREMLARLEP